MEFVSSQKRKQKIIRNGFIYVFQKDLANEVRSYECELRRKSQCKAKIKLDLGDNVIEQLNEHTHPPSQVKVELTKVKSRIKDTAESSEELPQRIIANELANISAATMANLPRRENLGRTIRQQRNDRHQPPNPEIRAEIPVLPLEYQLSENGEQFLLFDSDHGNDDRILIYGTDQDVQLLANSGEWYCDGTFSVSAQIFFQLYTIHARINSKAIPCIFGLLPSKTRITYNRFFSEIRNHLLAAGNEPNNSL